MKMWRYIIIPIVAITIIAILEILAIKAGLNGTCLSLSVGIIGVITTGGTMKLKEVIKG